MFIHDDLLTLITWRGLTTGNIGLSQSIGYDVIMDSDTII